MLTTLQSIVLGGVTLVTSCLLYREVARAVLSSKRFNAEVHPLPNPPVDRARVSGRGRIADDISDVCYIDPKVYDAVFVDDVPSMPVRPRPATVIYTRPLLFQEDGSPLMYTDSFEAGLDALRASAHGAWMNRERGEN